MFWVYENWMIEHKAVVHRASCGSCKNGTGVSGKGTARNRGAWRGPFKTVTAAEAAARTTGATWRRHSCV